MGARTAWSEYWFPLGARVIVTRLVQRNMEPKPQEKTAVPDQLAAQQPAEPAPELRPEDEALVVERLRELGYIE